MAGRRKSKKVFFGQVGVGEDADISVQSMTNTKTANIDETLRQIQRLTEAGCEIIRVAVPDMESAAALSTIKKSISIPLIADIHFDHRLAIRAIEEGVDGLRINPGNIGGEKKVSQVVQAACNEDIPIRVGVNSGSIEKRLLKKYGHPTAEAMVESALTHIKMLEKNDFYNIIVSLKATDIWMTIKAHELMAEKCDYPFHIGITEAGTPKKGAIKSAVGIGSLLSRGYGDTIRVSLTGDPVREVETAWNILESLNLRQKGPQIISCPTCGRTNLNLSDLAAEVEERIKDIDLSITVAVMGCEVNGPGEAREADIGIAGGNGTGLIFRNGKKIKKVDEDKLVDTLINEIKKMESDNDENV